MKSYSTLLLDLDGTLFDFGSTERIALKKLFNHISLEINEENRRIYHEVNLLCWQDYEQGIISMERLKVKRFEDFLAVLGLKWNAKELSELFIEYLSEEGIVIDGSISTLEKLKKNYKLVLITNGIASVQRGRLKDSNTEHFFDSLVISEEIGYQKPDKRFFDVALSMADSTREECLVIGDGLSSDIKGGRESGIDTLYLHLNTPCLANEGDYTYEAGSYAEVLKLLEK
ncbi:MAG: YjjG family noncanonical pyrimidine nucleotidase [Sphaerochaetaceae bacterium]|nr:YjjG family noncanonical pyrimidine nucleotidase [Sphaerochaetaceae bacterium]